MELTQKQKDILAYVQNMQKPMVVKGTAGSGKSVMTAEIAKIFAQKTSPDKIGIAVFTRALQKNLSAQLPNFNVNTAHKTLTLFFKANSDLLGKYSSIQNYNEDTEDILTQMQNRFKDELEKIVSLDLNTRHRYPYHLLRKEFDHIFALGIKSLDEYKAALEKNGLSKRHGFSRCTNVLDLPNIWGLFEKYKELIRRKNLYDFEERATICLEIMDKNPNYTRIFEYLIIDEFQDLDSNMIKALTKMCKNPNNIVFVGDLAQSLYQKKSWKQYTKEDEVCIFELTENLRNTRQIAKAAESLLDNEYKLKLYNRADYTEMVPSGEEGRNPVIVICRDNNEQQWYIQNELEHLPENETYGLLYRDDKKAPNVNKIIEIFKNCGKKYENHTMRKSQGMEFDNVFIIDANDDILPKLFEEYENKEDKIANERRILYVAMTRAHKRLFIISSCKPSRFLAEINPLDITPVIFDNGAYEELYKERIEELKATKEEIIEQILLNPTSREEIDLMLIKQLHRIDKNINNIQNDENEQPFNKYIFDQKAKIYFLGGDGHFKKDKILKTLRVKPFEFNEDDFECIGYEEGKNKDLSVLKNPKKCCDIIVGCFDHKTIDFDNFVEYLKQHKKEYPANLQFIEHKGGSVRNFSKDNITKAVLKSNKLRLKINV